MKRQKFAWILSVNRMQTASKHLFHSAFIYNFYRCCNHKWHLVHVVDLVGCEFDFPLYCFFQTFWLQLFFNNLFHNFFFFILAAFLLKGFSHSTVKAAY